MEAPKYVSSCSAAVDDTATQRHADANTRQNFQVQLGPFVAEAEKRGNAKFSWTQGLRKATPPAGFEDYFGAGPLWRFIDHDGSNTFDVLERIRDFPEGPNAEATMRLLVDEESAYSMTSVQEAMQKLLDIIDADPEIEVSRVHVPYSIT